MSLFYLVLLLGSGLLNFIFTVMILRELSAAGKPKGFFDLRWHVLKNLHRYKEITRKKAGRTGLAYYGYLATLGLLVLAAALLLNSLGR